MESSGIVGRLYFFEYLLSSFSFSLVSLGVVIGQSEPKKILSITPHSLNKFKPFQKDQGL